MTAVMRFLLVAVLALTFSAPAMLAAGNDQRQCLAIARDRFRDCSLTCTNNLADDSDMCRGVNHECAAACRASRGTCVDPLYAPLKACLAPCEATLDAAREACKTSTGCTQNCGQNAQFVACMNPAQVAAFVCRDACNDAFRTDATSQAALKACRDTFRACMKGCGRR